MSLQPLGEAGEWGGGLKLPSQPQNIPHAWSPAFPQCFLPPDSPLFPTVIEEKGVKMKLTVTDTPGFGDQINNENW